MADVIIVYDTKTGSTERAAALVLEGVKAAGADGVTKKVQDVTEQDLLDARGIILGSPNVNDNYSGPMREFIDGKLKNAKPVGKIGAAFGTYKWNTDNLRRLETAMEYANIKLVADGVNALHRPRSEDDTRLKALGETVGIEVQKSKT
ncbi:MAG TPA: flavodoxin domain-containing protein [Methanocella sp.]|jgi:flavorubredoxin